MKLTDIFKAFKISSTKGGNFAYIAENVATIYYIINDSEFGKKLSEAQLLFATALIDLTPYLNDGRVKIDDIKNAIVMADISVVGFPFCDKTHSSPFENYPNKRLVNLTMQLEAMIFRADTKTSERIIVDSIILNKKNIQDTIEKTITEGRNGKHYSASFKYIIDYSKSENFQKLVLSYEG